MRFLEADFGLLVVPVDFDAALEGLAEDDLLGEGLADAAAVDSKEESNDD